MRDEDVKEWMKIKIFLVCSSKRTEVILFQTYKLLSKVNCCKVAEMTNKMEWPHSPLRQISTANNLSIIQEEKKSKSKKIFRKHRILISYSLFHIFSRISHDETNAVSLCSSPTWINKMWNHFSRTTTTTTTTTKMHLKIEASKKLQISFFPNLKTHLKINLQNAY